MLLFRYKLENKKMNSSSPKISIIVPNYNYAHFLDKRIESILKQTYTDYEIILLVQKTEQTVTAKTAMLLQFRRGKVNVFFLNYHLLR